MAKLSYDIVSSLCFTKGVRIFYFHLTYYHHYNFENFKKIIREVLYKSIRNIIAFLDHSKVRLKQTASFQTYI